MKACIVGLLLLVAASGLGVAQTPKLSEDFKDLDLGKWRVKPVAPKKDPKTGFVVGGKNSTELIRKLKEIHGRSIADLEKDMRPGGISTSGFLGPDEKLLDVLAADNKFVVDDCGLTHQILARHLHELAAIGLWQSARREDKKPFVYYGRRFQIQMKFSRGKQPSPFKDGTSSGTNAKLRNLDNGKEIYFGLLVPYMMERFGFYEGKGTAYRLEPSEILEVLDFLVKKK
jgi:hypothetical protein